MMSVFLRYGSEPMDYINRVRNEHVKQELKRRFQEYPLRSDVADKFGQILEKHYFIVFVAAWSPDCYPIIAALAKLSVTIRNSNLIFRVVEFDDYRDLAEELDVQRIPTIVVYNERRREIGRFIEKPHRFGTVEEELWCLIKGAGEVRRL